MAAEKIIPHYKKLILKKIQFPIFNFPFPIPHSHFKRTRRNKAKRTKELLPSGIE